MLVRLIQTLTITQEAVKMKKYEIKVMRRTGAFDKNWFESKSIIIEARNQKSADNKLDKIARKLNNDYCRLSTVAVEI